jgi:ribosomal protein S18 acetylase RimI-like enzyme
MAELLPREPGTPERRQFVLIDETTGQRVGAAWLHVQQRLDALLAYLYDIRIDDCFQRQGYGRAALQALEAAARSAGCASLLLHVFGHNTGARSLYERCGYHVTNVNMRKGFGRAWRRARRDGYGATVAQISVPTSKIASASSGTRTMAEHGVTPPSLSVYTPGSTPST